jgi:hypothetical protein
MNIAELASSVTGTKKYYTYELAYPMSMGGAVFYVGKGSKRKTQVGIIDRIDEHEQQALQPLEDIKKWGRNVEKCQTIQSIWANGEQVVKRKVYETDIEEEAYAWESNLIEAYGIDNLTNKPRGGQPCSIQFHSALPVYSSDDMEMAEELLSANIAGKILGVSGKTIIRMRENGNFLGCKVGSNWKFKRGDIMQYRESRKFCKASL